MTIPMTRDGIERLEKEIKFLSTTRRREISEAIGVAREYGDIKENAEYHAAKEEQAQVEARIAQLANLRSNVMPLVISDLKSKVVNFGALVTLIDEDTEKKLKYRIVSEYEADFKNNMISNTSPLGKALMGKEKGEMVEVHAPGGLRYYEVDKIEYKKL